MYPVGWGVVFRGWVGLWTVRFLEYDLVRLVIIPVLCQSFPGRRDPKDHSKGLVDLIAYDYIISIHDLATCPLSNEGSKSILVESSLRP